ncbi:MAG: TonB-dependent siderophore receptor [Parvibaculaceae bacterium]|nr:TonB-dependent siderophore receptor [Parvibaculaceae bacterium]
MKTDARLLTTASRLALAAGVTASLSVFATAAAAQQTAPEQQEETEALVTTPLEVQGQGEGSYTVDHLSSSKQTAPLLDTPQTVNVIPEQVFREQGARNLTEILKNTPGISFNAGENGFGTSSNNFMLRGFDASGDIFYDGSRDSGSYTRDSFNVEQVEVFKGPAADNGRGSAGGYVNIVSKTPTARDFINADASYGFDEYDSEDRRRLTADVNQMISPNTAVRLNLLLEDSGIPGRDVAEAKSWGLAPSVAFGLGTEFRTILSFEHVERNDLPDWGLPGAAFADLNGNNPDAQAVYDPALAGLSRDNFYGLSSDFDDATSDVLLARFEYDLSAAATVSNQTRWSVVDRTARYTVPTGNAGGGVINTQTQFYDRRNESLTNLTNLSFEFATGSLKHNLATGVELTREQGDANKFNTVNSTTGAFNPDPNRAPGAPVAPVASSEVEVETVAAYVYDTVEFSRQWQATGGMRAERYKADIETDDTSIAGAATYSESDTLLGGKLGLVYKPAENGSVYVSYGVSQDPHTSFLSNPDISRTGVNSFPGFVAGAKPVTSHNYEIGTKWDVLDERLSLTAALFHTVKKDVPIALNSTTLLGYGEQMVQGLELGAAGRITQEWNVFAGLLLMDSERKHDPAFDAALRAANPGDYGAALTTNGDELAFTPNVSANLWTTYRFPIGLTLGGGIRHVGESYIGRTDDALRIIANSRYGELPAYTVFDAMVSYEINENVDIRLNVENLADKTYITSANWNGRRVQLGNPRTFTITTSFSF